MRPFRQNKNNNKPLISQILDLVPLWIFKNCTNTNKTGKYCSEYKTYKQFITLTFGQLKGEDYTIYKAIMKQQEEIIFEKTLFSE